MESWWEHWPEEGFAGETGLLVPGCTVQSERTSTEERREQAGRSRLRREQRSSREAPAAARRREAAVRRQNFTQASVGSWISAAKETIRQPQTTLGSECMSAIGFELLAGTDACSGPPGSSDTVASFLAVSAMAAHAKSSADVSATQSELISPVTAVRAAHGKIARHLHTAARPPGHEREAMELLIRTLPAHPAGPPHPRTQSLICC
ncbi:unnamed protein product [Pleuronectes platessa]|uniref:Uncharacterized protein n=1 Tax=Pleuronectes platessa TaxID=8262 RepID=A0A9N7TZW5_PLEPL|nr:unnamed protein product [Pleuronectes platessa]